MKGIGCTIKCAAGHVLVNRILEDGPIAHTGVLRPGMYMYMYVHTFTVNLCTLVHTHVHKLYMCACTFYDIVQ